MIYACGILGFVLGFIFGLCVINVFLRNYPRSALIQDKSLRWTYGLAVWIFGGLGAWAGILLYQRYIF